MAEAAPPPLPPEIPEAVPARQGRLTLHLVWVLPLVAAAIGGWLALQAWLARGPEVVIRFQSAEGIEVGKTRIKYKNVDIGLVKRLELSADRSRVLVHAEIDRDAAAMLVDDTRFWVVRPRVAVGSISGLSTLLSGSYIGMDVGKSANERREFEGAEVPPVVTAGLPGRQYILRSEQLGSLDIGSPVYYRRIEVGHVVAYALDQDGQGITVQVFINAPTSATSPATCASGRPAGSTSRSTPPASRSTPSRSPPSSPAASPSRRRRPSRPGRRSRRTPCSSWPMTACWR
ncbi:PqiB family protein [Chitinimonas koreensis]|uniref:PqiB family protein n=1 Tax=Chitinimonas koreensis TaxID=356302 RepID=UPI002240A9A0|nr:MlaD family protein [Chitinimonas koreensis]